MKGSRELAALLRREREALLALWRQRVMVVASARALDAPSLNDHIPTVVEALIAALEREEPDAAAALGAVHGRSRLKVGYDIEEIVTELSILRSTVIEVAEANGLPLQGRRLRLVNEAIDQAIAEGVRTFAEVATEARERDQEDHLAYVAHDLRTPLGSIALAVEALALTLPPPADAEAPAQRMLRTVRRNVARLKSLVDNVLEVSVGGADEEAQLQRRRVPLRRLIDGLLQCLEPSAGASGTRVVVDIAPELAVCGDPKLLQRAFENLLGNAIKHASPGTLTVSATRDGDVICCRVRDTGGGIPLERIAELFERKSAGGDARGLGLMIARQFIEQHGGRIDLERFGETGSAFRVELPADELATARD